MSLISTPYIFQPGTTIASAQVNANFAAIVGVVNGNLDGSNFSTVATSFKSSATGHITFAGGFTMEWGTPVNVPTDNASPVAITFDIGFPNACLGVFTTVLENTSNKPNLIGSYAYGVTATGFNLAALGGPSGGTVAINYLAIGY